MKFDIWGFSKSIEKIQVSFNSDKNNSGTLHAEQYTFLSYLPHFFLEWEMFQTKVVKETNTHSLFSNFFFRKSCRLWDNVENVVQCGGPQMTVWRMRITCWILKATNTNSECIIFIAFPLQQWLQERASVLRHSSIARLVLQQNSTWYPKNATKASFHKPF
jgi:hypothetical protein